MKKIILALVLSTLSPLLAADGQQKTVACAACHGPEGISSNPDWPNLAGQHVTYLIKQLKEFKEGDTRGSITMSPMAASLSDADMREIAEFYAKQPPATATETPAKYKKRGEELYLHGDVAKHIPACITCHSPDGKGNEQAGFPVIAGQHAQYLILELHAFKQKSRTNDLSATMETITANMTDEDMEAAAHYMASLDAVK